MSELISLDDAVVDLAHILTPYEHDNWDHETFYDKDNERFVIRYRAYTVVDNAEYGERIYTDSLTLPVKYSDAIKLLKENNSSAFYDENLKEVKDD